MPDGRRLRTARALKDVTAAAVEPAEGSLHHPSPRQDRESFGGVRPLDDFDRESRQHRRQRLAEHRTLVATVGEQLLQKRVEAEHRREQKNPAVAVLYVCGMD